jgi:Ser/Thr protein kinase RdoA (MazF antagonist)
MGKAIGKMHAASVNYNSENPKYLRRAYYEDDNAQLGNYLDPTEDAIVFTKFNELRNKLQQLPAEQDAYGLIHYDFHTDNFTVCNGEIFVFDFDDSHYFFFIYDLAASFHEAIWDQPLEKRQEFAARFIPQFWKGYSEEFQLDRKWLSYLPDFFKWREFIIYVCLIRDFTDEKTPDWLRSRLPPWITEFRDYIVNNTEIVDIPRDLREWFPEY